MDHGLGALVSPGNLPERQNLRPHSDPLWSSEFFRETEPTEGEGGRRKEIYYKELAHTVMEADKSQDPQGDLASRRHRRANGAAQAQS